MNEHLIPFGLVTWERLARGMFYVVRDWRRETQRIALPGGSLWMHPGDRLDLLRSEPVSDMAKGLAFGHFEWPAKGNVGGFQLLVTQDPNRVRAGRPRLRIDATRVLGRTYTDPMEAFL